MIPGRAEWPEPRAPFIPSDGDFSTIPCLEHWTWSGQPTPDRQWLLHEYIPVGQTTYLTGPGSAGKSLFGQQLVACVAAGLPMLGVETRHCPALYLTCEDDPDELHRRHKAITAALGIGDDDLGDFYGLASLYGEVGSELCRIVDGKVELTDAFHRLERTIRVNGIRFVVLDNVAHLFAGNENDRHHVATFVSALNRLAKSTGCTVLLLGHPNKAGDSFSGSTAWENQVRSRLYMETPADSIDRDVRVLSRQKSNYAQNGETIEFRWHQWAFIRDIDLPADTRAEMAVTIECAAGNAAFLACLASTTGQHRAVSHNPGSNYAPRVFTKMPEGKNWSEQQFAAAMERLLFLGSIKLDQPLWRGPNRVMKQGIASAKSAPTPLHEPPASTCTKPAEVLHASTPLYPTGKMDAATQAAASNSLPTIILAPGETGDEPVPDWEGEL